MINICLQFGQWQKNTITKTSPNNDLRHNEQVILTKIPFRLLSSNGRLNRFPFNPMVFYHGIRCR